jgi:membrane protein DedA with SNARE-associated domain
VIEGVPGWLDPLAAWLGERRDLAWLAVFAIAAGESLLLVGWLLPGAVMMFMLGALIALDQLPLLTTLIAATAGAIAGDLASFLIGRHLGPQLGQRWPLNRHPQALARGVELTRRHGGMAVVTGRFIGPLRPLVPAVAGMLAMPPARFLLWNSLSAVVWAPAYLLPGWLAGASLELASELAGRLTLLLLATATTLTLLIWLSQRLYRLIQPQTPPRLRPVARLAILLLLTAAPLWLVTSHPALIRLTGGLLPGW